MPPAPVDVTHSRRSQRSGILVNTIRYSGWYAETLCQRAQKVGLTYTIHLPSILTYSYQLLQLNDVKRATEFVANQGQSKRLQKCFFHFDIPRKLHYELLGQNDGYLRDLPASFPRATRGRRPALLRERCEGNCKVAYTLHVQMRARDQVVASCSHPAKIIPTLEPRPPTCIADFPGEYALAKSRRRILPLLAKYYTTDLLLKASEPAPLVLSHITDPVSFSTTLHLTQTTYARKGRGEAKPRDAVNCRCICALISSTFISSVPRKSVPTLLDLSTSAATLSRNLQICARTKATVCFSNWREVTYTLRCGQIQEPILPSTNSATGENDASKVTTQWEAKASVTLEFGHNNVIVPSFESSLLSLRYSLDLRVWIRESSRSRFHLVLPVQISYGTNTDYAPRMLAGLESPAYFV